MSLVVVATAAGESALPWFLNYTKILMFGQGNFSLAKGLPRSRENQNILYII
jgi:hypothetical protein